MTSNKIQLVSDLHIEFYNDPKLRDFVKKTDANILIIAGDLGIPCEQSYQNFLKECAEEYEKVFIITGNHEYYQTGNTKLLSMDDVNEEIKNICKKFNNVYFLNNDHYELDENYVILGTTLWSNIPESSYREVRNMMNDYRKIYYYDDQTKFIEQIKPQHISSVYENNKKWLENKVQEFKDKKIIIVSHHLPSYKMISKRFIGWPANCCFASNLDDLITPNIKYWLCGHTHDNTDIVINDCRCIVNPFGYKGENDKFIYDLVLDIN